MIGLHAVLRKTLLMLSPGAGQGDFHAAWDRYLVLSFAWSLWNVPDFYRFRYSSTVLPAISAAWNGRTDTATFFVQNHFQFEPFCGREAALLMLSGREPAGEILRPYFRAKDLEPFCGREAALLSGREPAGEIL